MAFSSCRRVAVLAACALVLTGCTPKVTGIEMADNATDPLCAETFVALPQYVAGEQRRETDTQSTAAWGEPASVILRCGVPSPPPTTEHCVGANGVDWIALEEGANWRLITYGREPAVEVLFNGEQLSSSSVMVDLADSVSRIPATGGCTTTDVETVIPEGVQPSS